MDNVTKKMVDSNSSRETGVFYLFPFGKFLKFCCRFFTVVFWVGWDHSHCMSCMYFFDCKDMVLY